MTNSERNWNFQEGEILNILKPVDWTSFDVVKKIRNLIKVKKVGHAGTLDPFATGVLVLCTGKATKKIEFLMNLDKEYIGTIKLGVNSDTYDSTGKIQTVTEDFSTINREKIEEVLNKYRGKFEPRIPAYSAAKKNGRRLYELARKGVMVEDLTKTIEIYELELLDFNPPSLTIRLRCSRGTYVRTLADDIGKDLQVGALLQDLKRTKIGHYTVEGSWTIEEFEKMLRKSENKSE